MTLPQSTSGERAIPEGSKIDRCIKDVKAKGGAKNPYAVCVASTGMTVQGKPVKHSARKHCDCGGKCSECKSGVTKSCEATGKPGVCAGQKRVTFIHDNTAPGGVRSLRGQTANNPHLVRQAAETARRMHQKAGGPVPHAYHVTNHPTKPGGVQVHLHHKGGEHIASYEPQLVHEGTTGGTAASPKFGFNQAPAQPSHRSWFGRLAGGQFVDEDQEFDVVDDRHEHLPVRGADDNELEAFEHMGFEKLERSLEHRKHPPRDPGAVAATIGRNKYGKEGMAKKAAAGRKHGEPERFCQETKKPGPCKGQKRGGGGMTVARAALANNQLRASKKPKAAEQSSRVDRHIAAARTSSAGGARVPGTSSGRFTLSPAAAKSISAKAKQRQSAVEMNRPAVPGTSGRFTMPAQRAHAISAAAKSRKPVAPEAKKPMVLRSPTTGRRMELYAERFVEIEMD